MAVAIGVVFKGERETMAKRSFYFEQVSIFLEEPDASIFGKLNEDNTFAPEDMQRNTWKAEIALLKETLSEKIFHKAKIAFEYTIPRIGSRVDVVLLINKIAVLLEFKIGGEAYIRGDLDQVAGYRDDIFDFHEYTWQNDINVFPVLIVSQAPLESFHFCYNKKMEPIRVNANTLKNVLEAIVGKSLYSDPEWANKWHDSVYHPTPTIIEAAEYMYKNHSVEEISRNDATAKNLGKTYDCVAEIIEDCKISNKKAICFITGVPGAGKTLAGLHIAIERRNIDNEEHAVFLSGNQPLVTVLQEALARNAAKNQKISKAEAKREAKSFIQIIHKFRDEMITTKRPPIEHVAVFDESQRAWTKEQLSSFMKRKKGIDNYQYSEPQFLIEAMDRHKDWAVIICLVGGGQEINTGEAGIQEWFFSIKKYFTNWDVYVSEEVQGYEYTKGEEIRKILPEAKLKKDLHLSVPLRSFRNTKVSDFVKYVIDGNSQRASDISKLLGEYPIYVTRNIKKGKSWVNQQVGRFGKKRAGVLGSSNGLRLQPEGVFVKNDISVENWFLDGREDVRSSYAMEIVATEFDIQGLEIDFAVICWDLNFCPQKAGNLRFKAFKGTKWNRVSKEENQKYIKNAYRVLLTRAREGFVIFVPLGDKTQEDITRPSKEYDEIFNYFISCGIKEL